MENPEDVSLPPAQLVGWGLKIGGDEAHVSEKSHFRTAKTLAKSRTGRKIPGTTRKTQFDAMNHKSNGKSRMNSTNSPLNEAAALPYRAPEPRISVTGIDTIRFVAALWVAFGHGARFPLEAYVDKHSCVIAMVSVGLSKMIFNGVLAVIVFLLFQAFAFISQMLASRPLMPDNF